MASGKQSYQDFIRAEGHDVRILVPDAPDGIPAQSQLLKMVSSLYKDMPPSDTWDLRTLQLPDLPTSKQLLTDWLQLLHSSFGQCARPPIRDLNEVHALLILSDALAANTQFLQLSLQHTFAEIPPIISFTIGDNGLVVTLDLRYTYWIQDLQLLRLVNCASANALVFDDPLLVDECRHTAAEKIEEWLHLSHKLGITYLIDTLERFLQLNALYPAGLIRAQEHAVIFSPRVIAVVSKERLLRAWITSQLNVGSLSRDFNMPLPYGHPREVTAIIGCTFGGMQLGQTAKLISSNENHLGVAELSLTSAATPEARVTTRAEVHGVCPFLKDSIERVMRGLGF